MTLLRTYISRIESCNNDTVVIGVIPSQNHHSLKSAHGYFLSVLFVLFVWKLLHWLIRSCIIYILCICRDVIAEEGAPAMGAKGLCIPFEQPAEIKPTDKCIAPDCTNKPNFYTLFGRSYWRNHSILLLKSQICFCYVILLLILIFVHHSTV